ncbi:MAG: hypothetical protein ABH821_05885, partial [archaeon]
MTVAIASAQSSLAIESDPDPLTTSTIKPTLTLTINNLTEDKTYDVTIQIPGCNSDNSCEYYTVTSGNAKITEPNIPFNECTITDNQIECDSISLADITYIKIEIVADRTGVLESKTRTSELWVVEVKDGGIENLDDTLTVVDDIKPVIVTAPFAGASRDSVVVSWKTDELTNGKVYYGIVNVNEEEPVVFDTDFTVSEHSVT